MSLLKHTLVPGQASGSPRTALDEARCTQRGRWPCRHKQRQQKGGCLLPEAPPASVTPFTLSHREELFYMELRAPGDPVTETHLFLLACSKCLLGTRLCAGHPGVRARSERQARTYVAVVLLPPTAPPPPPAKSSAH